METYRRVIGPTIIRSTSDSSISSCWTTLSIQESISYNTYVEDVQLGMAGTQILSYIDASTPIVVLTHAPLFRYTGMADGVLQMGKGFSNPDKWIGCWKKFSKFERIHIISGHTHTNYFCRYSDRVTEQNNIAAAASSWQIYGPEKRHLSKDGTPGRIYDLYIRREKYRATI